MRFVNTLHGDNVAFSTEARNPRATSPAMQQGTEHCPEHSSVKLARVPNSGTQYIRGPMMRPMRTCSCFITASLQAEGCERAANVREGRRSGPVITRASLSRSGKIVDDPIRRCELAHRRGLYFPLRSARPFGP
jgi:hypothetical protein